MMLINTMSVNKMIHLIHDLIVDGEVELAGITETWLRSGVDVSLSLLCPPGLGLQHHP